MEKATRPPDSPDAYVAALTGWQQRYVGALRATVLAAAPMAEGIKWGHLVYHLGGPVLLIRAEAQRVLFGFWRGKLLRHLEPRLAPGGKYEMATLALTEDTPLEEHVVVALTHEAARLNEILGDPTRIQSPPHSTSRVR